MLVGWIAIAYGQEGQDGEGSRPVGGSLAGWGAVPIASEQEREEGLTHLWGQLQVWTTVWDQDLDPLADPATYGDPEADAGFSLRRARFGFDGYVPMRSIAGRHQVDYALSVGVGAPYDALTPGLLDVQIVDAFGRWALPGKVGVSSVAIGLQRVPFSREALISSADLVFQEVTPGTNWLTPNREVGLLGSQSLSLKKEPEGPQLLLRVGAFNGGADLYGDAGRGLLGAARLEYSAGDPYRTFSLRKESALGVAVSALRDDDLSTRTHAFGGDLLARYRIVTAMVEGVWSRIEPTDTEEIDPDVVFETNRLGLLGQVSVFVPTREASGLEIAARYSTFDDDQREDSIGEVQQLHAGVTWRNLLPRVDIGAGYVARFEPANVPSDTIRIWTQFRPEGRF